MRIRGKAEQPESTLADQSRTQMNQGERIAVSLTGSGFQYTRQPARFFALHLLKVVLAFWVSRLACCEKSAERLVNPYGPHRLVQPNENKAEPIPKGVPDR